MFEGEFEDDEKKHGTFKWKSGDTYTGDWKNSLMHGQGVYTCEDKRQYSGQWVNGYKHGHGVFTWPSGDRYEGEFNKDWIQGYGEHHYSDGRIYKGEWYQDKKHGYGILLTSEGEKMEGFWTNNLMHGIIIYTDKEGRRFEERWNYGTCEGSRNALRRTAAEMESLLQAKVKPQWAPDDLANECFKCRVGFSFIVRRHHCRHCGQVFCGECTNNKIAVPRLDFPTPVRVCDECFLPIKCSMLGKKSQE
eukprot:TRINITY_DN1376_c0_g1_i2.p1 TRINITY_DN1376_c0_g1~~TRINITY_DN1376_c0_g1_i2.p1  ORF type:complete len:248 (-),score=32.21 TRINITY_DN1376_c0_g1_i2:393-1136(-)